MNLVLILANQRPKASCFKIRQLRQQKRVFIAQNFEATNEVRGEGRFLERTFLGSFTQSSAAGCAPLSKPVNDSHDKNQFSHINRSSHKKSQDFKSSNRINVQRHRCYLTASEKGLKGVHENCDWEFSAGYSSDASFQAFLYLIPHQVKHDIYWA